MVILEKPENEFLIIILNQTGRGDLIEYYSSWTEPLELDTNFTYINTKLIALID